MGMEQLHSGEIYYPTDDSIMEVQLKCLDKLYNFNATRPSEMEKRMSLMKELLADGNEKKIEKQLLSNLEQYVGNTIAAVEKVEPKKEK